MSFERLLKKRPLQRKSSISTDNQCCRLRRATLDPALVQQVPITDQTAGAMGSECSCSDQDSITPGERFLKNTTIS